MITTMTTQSETMTKRECASPLCTESFEPAPPYESARYCSQDCYHEEKAHDAQAPSQEPVQDRYVRRWVFRLKLGERELRITLPFSEEL